jgi:hypothetical protein
MTKAILITVLLAGLALPGAAQAASIKHCKSVEDIGTTGADPGDANNLTAEGTGCATARKIARRSTDALVKAIRNSEDGVVRSYRVLKWTCKPKGFTRVTVCTYRSKRIKWRLGP